MLCIWWWCVRRVLTPNYLLYERNLDHENKIAEEIDFGVSKGSDLWEKECMLQNIVEHFWSVWYREYLDSLREKSCKSLGRVWCRDIERLAIVVELLKSNDGLVLDAKVKVSKTKNFIRRPVNCLYPTDVHTTE